MRILIEERVHQAIESFYDAAILKPLKTRRTVSMTDWNRLPTMRPYSQRPDLRKNGLIRDGRNLSARISILRMRLRLTFMGKR